MSAAMPLLVAAGLLPSLALLVALAAAALLAAALLLELVRPSPGRPQLAPRGLTFRAAVVGHTSSTGSSAETRPQALGS